MTLVQRRLASLAAFLVVGGGVGAYAYYGAFKGKQQDAEQKSKDDKLASFSVADVKEIKVQAKGQTFELIGDGEGEKKWRLTKPVQTAAEKTTVEGLITHFADMKRTRALDGKDLKVFGLEPAQQTVTFKTGDGKEHTYAVGKKNTFDDAVYLQRVGDEKVSMVPGTVGYQVDRDLFGWREKRVLLFEEKDAQRLEVELQGKPAYTLEKKGEDWHIVAPAVAKAETSQVTTLLGALRLLRAKTFASDSIANDQKSLAPYGLDKPAAVVTVTLGAAGAKTRVAFGTVKNAGGGEQHYAHQEGAPAVLEVSESMAKKFDQRLGDLRDKTLLGFQRDEIKKIKLAENDQSFVLLEKKAETWEIVSPEAKPANDSKISNLLFKLSTLKATSIVAEQVTPALKKAHGLDAGKLVTLYKADGSEAAWLLLGAAKGEEVFVLSQNGARIDLIEKTQLNDLVFEAKHWAKEDQVAQP